MTSREQEIFQIIKENPLISQQQLADQLQINRSSVAVHIGNLMKKGYIKGKGYIVEEEKKALIIGGANMDLEGSPYTPLKLYDSNPGRIETSQGGVGRNIADNLARLSTPVRLLTAIGEDFYGEKILRECEKQGMDMNHVLRSKDYATSVYLSIMDENHDMKVAISQMDILRLMSPHWLEQKKSLFKDASLICIDANLTKESVEYIVQEAGDTPIFADPVSSTKARVFENVLDRLHTFKPNRIEAETLLGIPMQTIDQVRQGGEVFMKKGVQQVFISLGAEGVYYKSRDFEAMIKGEPKVLKSATGAGDAFMAAVIYGYLEKYPKKKTLEFAMGAALTTLSSDKTIHPDLSLKKVEEQLQIDEVILTTF